MLVESGGANTGARVTSSTMYHRRVKPFLDAVRRGGSSGEAMPLGAGRVFFHAWAEATVVPVPLETGSW